MADSTPPTGGSQAPASPPKTGRDSLVWWKYYLHTYVLLGIAALLLAGLVWDGIESGKWLWYRIGAALFLIAIAIANFATLHRRE
jgi:hypothetical protein